MARPARPRPDPAAPLAPPGWPCLTADGPDRVRLQVHVVPGARRTACAGLHDGALRVRLAAAPVEGQANAALLAWVAAGLGVPRQAVTLERGATHRRKVLGVEVSAEAMERWLTDALSDAKSAGETGQ